MEQKYYKCPQCGILIPQNTDYNTVDCPICDTAMVGPRTIEEFEKLVDQEPTNFTEQDISKVVIIKEDCLATVVHNSKIFDQVYDYCDEGGDLQLTTENYIRDRELTITEIDSDDDDDYAVAEVSVPLVYRIRIWIKKEEVKFCE